MTSVKSRDSSEVPLALKILPVAYEYILWELTTVVTTALLHGVTRVLQMTPAVTLRAA